MGGGCYKGTSGWDGWGMLQGNKWVGWVGDATREQVGGMGGGCYKGTSGWDGWGTLTSWMSSKAHTQVLDTQIQSRWWWNDFILQSRWRWKDFILKLRPRLVILQHLCKILLSHGMAGNCNPITWRSCVWGYLSEIFWGYLSEPPTVQDYAQLRRVLSGLKDGAKWFFLGGNVHFHTTILRQTVHWEKILHQCIIEENITCLANILNAFSLNFTCRTSFRPTLGFLAHLHGAFPNAEGCLPVVWPVPWPKLRPFLKGDPY